ncbi:MAG: esterase/lipase family protein [Ilumatobacteraceae bacterium]
MAGIDRRCGWLTAAMSDDRERALGPMRAPNLAERLGEVRLLTEPVRLAAAAPRLARRRASTARTVVVIPGIGAGDRPLAPLRAFLGRTGHRPLPWGLGRQGPDVAVTLERFVPRVAGVIDAAGDPVSLVGWSLGGIVARETARMLNESRPGSVSKVVTFGTPVEGPRHTIARRYYTDEELDRIDEYVADRRGRPVGCDVVAIHSRRDGVVGWRACLDVDTPNTVNVEVRSSHLGMGVDPDVWMAIADALDAS